MAKRGRRRYGSRRDKEFQAVTKSAVKKVVLAYSGGLDTSIILKWLEETYGCEIVTFTADLGQGEELAPAREKALAMGVKPENIFIEDLREEFVRDFVFPMFRANTLYEGQYLLGTSIARPLIAKRQIEIANLVGADAVCHGATGKGNDQVRFEVSYYALKPDVKVIAPWREWSFEGRPDLIAYAKQHGIQVAQGKEQAAPFSIDANLLHTSSEGLVLEDPDLEAPEIVTKRKDRRTITPEEAPDRAETVTLSFERGDLAAVNGKKMKAHELLAELNRLGAKHGVGGLDLVENRFVGMKSRGYYETPGGTILWHGHRAIESITLDRGAMHLKDELMPRYASLIYNGFWWTPERTMLQAAIDASQASVTGEVKLKLYKGGVRVAGRSSPYSLYSKALVGFDEAGGYNQKDAEGFIKLNALRLRILAERDKKRGKNE
jgi:argininosuccinate synthase